MEYEILKPPPHRHRTVWILVAVLVVAALGGGAYVLGTHRGATATPADQTTSPPASVAHAVSVVATVPATGATDVPSNQVVTVTLSDPVASVTAVPTFTPIVAGTWKRTATDTSRSPPQPPSCRR